MTSTHRYPLPPPNTQNDFRLPSLKDLNFYRPSGAQPGLPPSQQPDLGNLQPEQPPQQIGRHPVAWSRSVYQSTQPTAQAPHQQYTPVGHEVPPKVEYTPKHENVGYAHPGVPLSVQSNAVPNSVSMGPPRSEEPSRSPNQPKRQRTAPTAASRDTRASRQPSGYPPPQYASYQPPPSSASQYHSVPPGLPPTNNHATQPATSPHEQIQHQHQHHHHPHPMSHPGYTYQPAYVQPRQTLLHPQPPHSSHMSQPSHSNPYPSPGPPPPSAPVPPPQSSWAHPHSQHPQPQFQQPPPPPPQHNSHSTTHVSPHHHQSQQHQASIPTAPPSQPVQPHPHHPPQQSAPPANQHVPQITPSVQYQPPQQQYPPQYQHPPQQQQQTPPSFVRPIAINPSSLENRPTYPPAEPPRVPSAKNDAMSEITDHCNILYSFANQYATLQQTNPHAQPSPDELEKMSTHALKVVRLLEIFRKTSIPENVQPPPTSATGNSTTATTSAPMQTDSPGAGESSRPPKRPWEDTQQEGTQGGEANSFQDQFSANPSPDPKAQSTAEQDMEIIRTKRATSTAVANGSSGQPKSKYRKRSMGQRASPPGKCHSCNIRETPEWRRGPDGARTLCNACGLHYAKLMRKQNKSGVNGEVPHIDLETLRASTRAADIAEKARSKQAESSSSASKSSNQQQQQKSSDSKASAAEAGPSNAGKPGSVPPPATIHQGSFQLVNVMAPSSEHHPNQSHANPSSSSTAPTPMQVDSRPASQHASAPTPQLQTIIHGPPPASSSSSHHPHTQQHQSHPPWPTTAATTGAAAAATGAVSGPSAGSVRGGGGGGGGSGASHPPLDYMRRQYSMPNRSGSQPHQQASR